MLGSASSCIGLSPSLRQYPLFLHHQCMGINADIPTSLNCKTLAKRKIYTHDYRAGKRSVQRADQARSQTREKKQPINRSKQNIARLVARMSSTGARSERACWIVMSGATPSRKGSFPPQKKEQRKTTIEKKPLQPSMSARARRAGFQAQGSKAHRRCRSSTGRSRALLRSPQKVPTDFPAHQSFSVRGPRVRVRDSIFSFLLASVTEQGNPQLSRHLIQKKEPIFSCRLANSVSLMLMLTQQLFAHLQLLIQHQTRPDFHSPTPTTPD